MATMNMHAPIDVADFLCQIFSFEYFRAKFLESSLITLKSKQTLLKHNTVMNNYVAREFVH